MMKCGIDQSFTSTGIVIVDQNNVIVYHKIITSDTTTSIYHRARSIAQQIQQVLQQFNIEHVTLEALSFSSFGNATRNLAGLQFVIINSLIDNNITFNTIAPTSLKKQAADNGKATKQQMVDALPLQQHQIITNNYKKTKGRYDITDAFFLAIHK